MTLTCIHILKNSALFDEFLLPSIQRHAEYVASELDCCGPPDDFSTFSIQVDISRSSIRYRFERSARLSSRWLMLHVFRQARPSDCSGLLSSAECSRASVTSKSRARLRCLFNHFISPFKGDHSEDGMKEEKKRSNST